MFLSKSIVAIEILSTSQMEILIVSTQIDHKEQGDESSLGQRCGRDFQLLSIWILIWLKVLSFFTCNPEPTGLREWWIELDGS